MGDQPVAPALFCCALCFTKLQSFPVLRNLSEPTDRMKSKIYSRQVAKLENIFLPLRLCVFAGNIPVLLGAAVPR